MPCRRGFSTVGARKKGYTSSDWQDNADVHRFSDFWLIVVCHGRALCYHLLPNHNPRFGCSRKSELPDIFIPLAPGKPGSGRKKEHSACSTVNHGKQETLAYCCVQAWLECLKPRPQKGSRFGEQNKKTCLLCFTNLM